jgi:hypothetical protein
MRPDASPAQDYVPSLFLWLPVVGEPANAVNVALFCRGARLLVVWSDLCQCGMQA